MICNLNLPWSIYTTALTILLESHSTTWKFLINYYFSVSTLDLSHSIPNGYGTITSPHVSRQSGFATELAANDAVSMHAHTNSTTTNHRNQVMCWIVLVFFSIIIFSFFIVQCFILNLDIIYTHIYIYTYTYIYIYIYIHIYIYIYI